MNGNPQFGSPNNPIAAFGQTGVPTGDPRLRRRSATVPGFDRADYQVPRRTGGGGMAFNNQPNNVPITQDFFRTRRQLSGAPVGGPVDEYAGYNVPAPRVPGQRGVQMVPAYDRSAGRYDTQVGSMQTIRSGGRSFAPNPMAAQYNSEFMNKDLNLDPRTRVSPDYPNSDAVNAKLAFIRKNRPSMAGY